jgi:hypothetical protein
MTKPVNISLPPENSSTKPRAKSNSPKQPRVPIRKVACPSHRAPLPALPRSHDLHPTRSPNIPHTNRPKRHHVPLQTPLVPQPLPLTIDHAPPSSKAKLSPLATSSATSSDASPMGTSSCPAASSLSRPYSPLTGRERWGHRAAHGGVGTEECCGGGAGAGAGIEQVREIGGESGVVRFGSRRDRSGRMRT